METITSRKNPLTDLFRTVARGRNAGHMLLEGEHLVQAARAARVRIRVAAFTDRALESRSRLALATQLERDGARIARVSESVMEALSPTRTPSGVAAIAERPDGSLRSLLNRTPALLIIAVGVQDPGNVGAAIRAADAGSATGMVLSRGCADPFGWKALRGAMGSAFRLPLAIQEDPAAAIEAARRSGARVLAATPRGGEDLYQARLRESIAFLIGGEGPGLSSDLARLADATISIPMRSPVESLNTAVATALLVYEAFRQRRVRTTPLRRRTSRR